MLRPAPWCLPSLLLLAACSPAPPPEPPPAPPASAALSAAPAASSSAPAAPGPQAPVVVAVVVDQMAAWVARERWPQLPEDGGFARLRREGTWLVEAHHPHAATDTAPGHAILFTGASPSESGIFANEVLDGAKRVSILRDPSTKVVSAKGVGEGAGSSLARLRVDTLADRLKARHPDAFVAAVSLKDRGALFGCGRKPDACLWFDTGLDAFVTSTAFAQALPAWSVEEAQATARAREKPWELRDAAWLKKLASTPDDQPGEGDWDGLGRVFPHVLSAAKKPASAFRASPAGDERVLALAAAALRHEAAGKVPTLLAISLSSNDYVGHIFGPESWEAWDHLLHLDAALAAFLKKLDDRFGKDRYAVVLGADHGVNAMPETHGVKGARHWCGGKPDPWGRSCGKGGRLHMDALAKEFEAEAGRVLGKKNRWIAGLADPFVFLSAEGRALPAERRKALLGALEKVGKKTPCIARIIDARSRAASCPPLSDESDDALLCRSIPTGIDGEFYVLPAPGCFFDSDYVPGFGVSHGTPYLHDRAVPVLARAPGRVAAGKELTEPRASATFAATVAALLGLDPPEPTRGVASLLSP